MTPASSLGASIAICAAAAALEGACAGTGVKSFFATLRSPKYSAPLPVWYAIGGLYYVTFGFVVYRLLRLGDDVPLRGAAIAIVVLMMVANALWNLIFFRARNLYAAYLTGNVAPVLDLALLWCLLRLDVIAAAALVPYLLYRVYAAWWGRALWLANQ